MISDGFKELLLYLRQYKFNLFIVFCSLLTVSISLLGMGAIFKRLIDEGLHENNINSINVSILHMSLLITVFACGSFFRSYFINLVAEKVITRIKLEGYENLLHAEISSFEELKIGDVISRLSSDLEAVSNIITNFLSFFVRNSVMLTGAAVMMFYQSVKLSLIVMFIVPLLLMPILFLSKRVRGISKKALEGKADLASIIQETFTNVQTIYAFNRQNYMQKIFAERIQVYLGYSARRFKFRSLFFAFALIAISGSITAIIWAGSISIAKGSMTSGQMISFIYYAIIVGISAGGIAEFFSEAHNSIIGLERVFELKRKKELEVDENETVTGDISFQNVSFSYPSRVNILALDNISFIIKQGSFTGIAGKSGSGKSTLMQLLLNFYRYSASKILIGGCLITPGKASNIRKIIAYAPQDPAIFSGSIRYNIMFSNPYAREEDFERIVKLCLIDSFALNLAQGLDTEIGERGVRMSGGQKQRIAIARALLYKPDILLLDEATSALDNESEKQILDNIKEYMIDKTIVMIAHRLSALKESDNILVMERGRIVDSGKHKDLIKTSAHYLSLYKDPKIN